MDSASAKTPASLSDPAERTRRRNWLLAGCASLAAAGLIGATALTGAGATSFAVPAAISVEGGSAISIGPAGSTTADASYAEADHTEAEADQLVGIVNINTALGYQGGAAAGTGMVLSADGEILTNNHVIEGATAIQVTVLSTGEAYTAQLVGTAPTLDIAVLRLVGAPTLTPARLGSSSSLAMGDDVIAVGNAGDDAGTAAAKGQITALEQSITATDSSGADAEKLSGLIETDAAVVAGDSGGPLYDAQGTIIGIDTAGSSANGGAGSSANGGAGQAQSYAIPIDDAVSVAQRILSGEDTDVVHQGLPAFLGVSVMPTASPRGLPFGQSAPTTRAAGARIAGVVDGTPAQRVGLAAGDTIIGIDAAAIGSAEDLSRALSGYDPGDSVTLTWTDSAGGQHSGSVTLIEGAAD